MRFVSVYLVITLVTNMWKISSVISLPISSSSPSSPSSSQPPPPPPPPPPQPPRCMSVVTFNAQLAYNVLDIGLRKSLIMDRVSQMDEDFVCVQEVVFEKDVVDLLTSVESQFPYHYSYLHDDVSRMKGVSYAAAPDNYKKVGSDKCSSLLECIQERCFSYLSSSTWSAVACVSQQCSSSQGVNYSADCLSCVTQYTFNCSLQEALTECDTSTGNDVRVNHPGLVVLSKRPLRDVTYKSFFPGKPVLIERGYITATVEGFGPVVCAHTSHEFDLYYEGLSFESYTDQQRAEIDMLASLPPGYDVIAGDFNNGPSVRSVVRDWNLSGELEENYDYMMSLGFRSPYADNIGRCSTCDDNTGGKGPVTLKDHVLIRGDNVYTLSEMRVLDSSPPVSEHYGVGIEVCRIALGATLP